jgi:asparagine synthase (glutamine-hydrolysing)
MCGIFGYVTTDAQVEGRIDADAAHRSLRHRGPDGEGRFVGTAGPVRCTLLHTRLSIIDLSDAARQPMTTSEARYTISYNGELYNFRQLRQELEAAGTRFRTASDTEVVLHAYARWGEACLPRLRGMFAFAIWDAEEGSLFLARDRFGIKPLYYAVVPGGVAFASEIRALLRSGVVPARVSRTGLAGYLSFGSAIGADSIVDGVQSLPAAHSLLCRGGTASITRYWELARCAAATTDAEATTRTAALLEDAVSAHLVADVPVGVFLSGGMDSTAVLALAAKALRTPVRALTVTFEECAYDEGVWASETARRFGAQHQTIRLSSSAARGQIEAALRALDQPSIDGVNTYCVSKAAHEAGLKVALSGLGADEVFAGYSGFRRFARAIAVARGVARGPASLTRGLERAARSLALPNRMRKGAALAATGGDPVNAYAVLRSVFLPEQTRALLAPDWRGEPATLQRPEAALDLFAAGTLDEVGLYSVLEIENYLCHTLLRDTDAMSMAHGLEVRVPFLDHALVEHLIRLPGQSKLKPGLQKALLAQAVPEIPAAASMRPKQGFMLPFELWFRGPLKPWIEDLLLGPFTRSLGLFDTTGIEQLWCSFLRGERHTSWSRIWCVAALSGWCRENSVTA